MASRRKRKERVPSRSARYAKSPKPSKTAEDQYSLALRRIVAEWGKTVLREGLEAARETTRTDAKDPKVASKKISAAAKKLANAKKVGKAIDKAAETIDKHTTREITKLGIPLEATPGMRALVNTWRKSNTKLIRNFLEKEAKKVEDILANSFGRRYESVAKDIQERLQISSRRADLIARDQSLTLNAQIAREKQEAAGIEEYIWVTAGDEKVRDDHKELDGKRFRFDDPPIVDKRSGERGHPGDFINCRCVQYPIIPALDV